MKLSKINRIQNFGVFENFAWNTALPDFTIFNAFYGWNYSGKTTLSRIFRCFELGQLHEDYSDSIIEIQDHDSNKYQKNLFPRTLPIRVFNSDFITANLKWHEGIEPIFLLGQENIQLQEQLVQHKKNLEKIKDEINCLEQEKKGKELDLATAMSNRARSLKHDYSIPVFDKRHFEPFVIDAIDQASVDLLSQEKTLELTGIYYNAEKKELLSHLAITLPELSRYLAEVNVLIEQTVKSNVIERLKENPTLNAWVKQGMNLHEKKSVCEFCGSPLDEKLLEVIGLHFSEDYERLLANLNSKILQLQKLKIIISLPDPAKLYSELCQTYLQIKTLLENKINEANQNIEELTKKLEEKKLKAFESMSPLSIADNCIDISQLIENTNEIIKTHNRKTNEFDQQKAAAYNKLISNSALEFIISHRYKQTLADIKTLNESILTKSQLLPRIQNTIDTIEQQISEAVKGADTINNHLNRYFGKEDIQISVTSNNKFQLQRNGLTAKNLSEGEKTAIAFAYFITRLKDKNTDFSNIIVYIDDPISSLDSNHLFNTYSFIKDQFYEFDASTKQHKCKCAQFFISTHNYEFFNLIKDWLSKTKASDRSYFLISRKINTSENNSTLQPLHTHLIKFKSEYSYLFSLICIRQNLI